MGLVQFLDRIGKLAPAPVFQSMYGAATGLDGRTVALKHGRNLFTLVRVDQKHYFIMSHQRPLMDWQPFVRAKGKELKIKLLEAADFTGDPAVMQRSP
jgi:hypothetical protein